MLVLHACLELDILHRRLTPPCGLMQVLAVLSTETLFQLELFPLTHIAYTLSCVLTDIPTKLQDTVIPLSMLLNTRKPNKCSLKCRLPYRFCKVLAFGTWLCRSPHVGPVQEVLLRRVRIQRSCSHPSSNTVVCLMYLSATSTCICEPHACTLPEHICILCIQAGKHSFKGMQQC